MRNCLCSLWIMDFVLLQSTRLNDIGINGTPRSCVLSNAFHISAFSLFYMFVEYLLGCYCFLISEFEPILTSFWFSSLLYGTFSVTTPNTAKSIDDLYHKHTLSCSRLHHTQGDPTSQVCMFSLGDLKNFLGMKKMFRFYATVSLLVMRVV